MSLDLTPLTNAIARLSEGLERMGREAGDTQLRDGLIQRFEFTYDLAHKMIRRALEQASANPDEIDRMSFPELIRTASEQGLTASDWTAWRTWREMRNDRCCQDFSELTSALGIRINRNRICGRIEQHP